MNPRIHQPSLSLSTSSTIRWNCIRDYIYIDIHYSGKRCNEGWKRKRKEWKGKIVKWGKRAHAKLSVFLWWKKIDSSCVIWFQLLNRPLDSQLLINYWPSLDDVKFGLLRGIFRPTNFLWTSNYLSLFRMQGRSLHATPKNQSMIFFILVLQPQSLKASSQRLALEHWYGLQHRSCLTLKFPCIVDNQKGQKTT